MIKKTYNPIIRENEYQNGLFPQIPIPEPKCAVVLVAKRDGYRVMIITNHSRVKASDIRKGRYDHLVEIDMHQKNIQIELTAMSKDQISPFTVTISGVAVVTEPDTVYHEQIKDVAQHIENGVQAEIQSMAAECDISESAFLKRSIENRFGAQVYIDNGISVSNINVLIKTDENHETFLKEKRRIEYQRKLDQDNYEAAQEAKQRFSDHGTAAYKEYVDGRISAAEANAQWREEQEKTFDMRNRQVQEFIRTGQQMEESDWIDKRLITQRAEEVLQGFSLGTDKTSGSSRIEMRHTEADESDIFREIED